MGSDSMKSCFCLITSALLLCAAELCAQEPPPSQAKWIWYPEVGLKDQLRFFRREFQLPEKPVGGTLNFSGDDVYTIWVNGRRIHRSVNFKCPPFEAEKYLKTGTNVIAAEVLNVISGAGFLMRAEVKLPGKTEPVVWVTDRDWKCSKESPEGWNRAGFDDSGWKSPAVIRGVTEQHTWRKMIDLRRFLSRREYRDYRNYIAESQDQVKKLRAETLDRLSKEPAAPQTKVVRRNGFPWFESGTWSFPVFLYNSVMLNTGSGPEGHLPRFRRFHDAGFRLFVTSVSLEKLWKENGEPDFASVETGFLNLLSAAPEARLLVMIDLTPPEWYVKKYPEELIRYGSGAVPVFSGDHLRVPMKRPSMASERWKADSGKVVAELVKKLEKSPAGKRIIAYQPAYGLYWEWHYFGMPKEMPDTGKAMTLAFRDYLKRKYGTDEQLRLAWKRENVSLNTAEVPVTERLQRPLAALRDPLAERRVLDYLDCHAEVVNRCQSFFNLTVKRAAAWRVPVGNYSGYFFGMAYPAEGWQTRTPEMFRSDAVDFQAAPYSYGFRGSGACGLPRNIFESYALNGKFSILESDARTHLSGDPNDGHSSSLAESVGQLTRDFCNAVTRGSGLWYYDFNGGWYDRPEYLSLFSRLMKIVQSCPDTARRSEVAYVCDFDSVPYHTNSVNPNEFTYRLISFTAQELFHSGAPFDTILWQDLDSADYKVYVFGNSFHPTKEKLAYLEQLRKKGKVLIFLYAAGALADTGADGARVGDFTGIKAKMHLCKAEQAVTVSNAEHPYTKGLNGRKFSSGLHEGPVFTVDDPEAEVLGEIELNGRKYPAFAVKDSGTARMVYCSIPFMSRDLFRNIFRASGVHIYSGNRDDVLFAGKGLVGIHTGKGGERILRLPYPAAKITRLLPDRKEFPAGSAIRFTASPASTVLFEIHEK